MTQAKKDSMNLEQFYGTTNFYRHPLWKGIVYTDGIQYVAEKASAYWLIDLIAGSLMSPEYKKAASKDSRLSSMIFYNLSVQPGNKAVLTANADLDAPNWFEHKIEFTDFPEQNLDVWAAWNGTGFTLMLKTEY